MVIWSNKVGITRITLSAIAFNGEFWNPKFQKTSYFFNIIFPAAPLGIINKVSFPTYDFFVCTDLFPEVGFVILVSVEVVAVTVVIILCYIATVINHSIRINNIFSVSPSAKTQMLQ